MCTNIEVQRKDKPKHLLKSPDAREAATKSVQKGDGHVDLSEDNNNTWSMGKSLQSILHGLCKQLNSGVSGLRSGLITFSAALRQAVHFNAVATHVQLDFDLFVHTLSVALQSHNLQLKGSEQEA
eukprot:2669030-Amphidinium_carterae.1